MDTKPTAAEARAIIQDEGNCGGFTQTLPVQQEHQKLPASALESNAKAIICRDCAAARICLAFAAALPGNVQVSVSSRVDPDKVSG